MDYGIINVNSRSMRKNAFIQAVRAKSDSNVIESLLEKDTDIYARDEYKKSALDYVVINNDIKTAHLFLKNDLLLALDKVFQIFVSNFSYLSEKNINLWVDFIVLLSGNINSKDGVKKSLISYAIQGADFRVIQILMSKGAFLDHKLMLEKIKTHIMIKQWIGLLLEAKNHSSCQDEYGKCVLMYLLEFNYSYLASKLIQAGFDVSNIDKNYNSTLDYAISALDFENMNLLFAAGARNFKIDKLFNLVFANRYKYYNFSQLVDFIIKSGIDINYNNPAAMSEPLIIICTKQKRLSLIKQLLKNQVDITVADSDGRTALDYAFSIGMQIACLLYEYDPQPQKLILRLNENYGYAYWNLFFQTKTQVDVTDINGNTALIHAVKGHKYRYVTKLIANNCNIDIKNNENKNAVEVALDDKNIDAAIFLVANGAKLNSILLLNKFPTVYRRHIFKKYLKLYYACTKDLNEKNIDDKTILFYAARTNDYDLCKELIILGANAALLPNLDSFIQCQYPSETYKLFELLITLGARISPGFFPNRFYVSGAHNLTQVLNLMLLAKIDINTSDSRSGDTILHAALNLKQMGLVHKLLALGANYNLVNKKNQTPLEILKSSKANDISLLLGYGALIRDYSLLEPKLAYLDEGSPSFYSLHIIGEIVSRFYQLSDEELRKHKITPQKINKLMQVHDANTTIFNSKLNDILHSMPKDLVSLVGDYSFFSIGGKSRHSTKSYGEWRDLTP